MRANRKTDSQPESRLRRELFRRGMRYRKNAPVSTSVGIVRPDVVFPGSRVVVFVDGCFWHSCPLHGNVPVTNRAYWELKLSRNRERDQRVTSALTSAGWLVLRFWEHDSVVQSALRVEEAVRRRVGWGRVDSRPSAGDEASI